MKWENWISKKHKSHISIQRISDGPSVIGVDLDWLFKLVDKGLGFYPYFSLSRESVPADPADFTVPALKSGIRIVAPPKLAEHMECGYTLKIQFLEAFKPALIQHVQPLARALRGKSALYAFLTPPGSMGLRVHRDASFLVVYQVHGSKNWNVWEPSDLSQVPSTADLVPNPNGSKHCITLDAGDAMFIPYGWPHAARAAGEEASLHLTWTIDTLSPHHLSSFLNRFQSSTDGIGLQSVREARMALRFEE